MCESWLKADWTEIMHIKNRKKITVIYLIESWDTHSFEIVYVLTTVN